ncbi:hypothetical protein R3P38DRAFT_2879832 [Favolaschia claudopus]|uniref:Uncharacterized protein n=1 Tax=Favolaschia claudopus TaxID=2862362 RepID=A0AAW0D2D7_9AGAR
MEATLDNKTNVLNAQIRTVHDNTLLYTLRTTFGYFGRKDTVLLDENPVSGAAAVVGAIHWHEKSIEIFGHRKSCSELKRRSGRFYNRTRHWRWAPDRKEYEVVYEREEWKATLDHNMCIAGRFAISFRPHIFSKTKPPLVHLTARALEEDEIFLILVFIYNEVRRQEKTNSSRLDASDRAW